MDRARAHAHFTRIGVQRGIGVEGTGNARNTVVSRVTSQPAGVGEPSARGARDGQRRASGAVMAVGTQTGAEAICFKCGRAVVASRAVEVATRKIAAGLADRGHEGPERARPEEIGLHLDSTRVGRVITEGAVDRPILVVAHRATLLIVLEDESMPEERTGAVAAEEDVIHAQRDSVVLTGKVVHHERVQARTKLPRSHEQRRRCERGKSSRRGTRGGVSAARRGLRACRELKSARGG